MAAALHREGGMKVRTFPVALVVSLLGLGACMTPRERQEKVTDDANASPETIPPHAPSMGDPGALQAYTPTETHLADADRQMREAFELQKASERLAKYEDAACNGISKELRTACPVVAPHVDRIQERVEGITLHLKPGAPASALAALMRCHFAFAEATRFERVPCPLYIKGVKIELRGSDEIDVFSSDPEVAAQVRRQARRMFGEVIARW